jgi:multiple sugar transport system permease protein
MTAVTPERRLYSPRQWLRSPQARSVLFTVLAAIAVFIIIFPFLWLVLASVRGTEDFLSLNLADQFPRRLDFSSYQGAFRRSDILRWMGNSLLVAVATTLLSLSVSAPASFALARLRFSGGRLGSTLLILCYAVPSIMLAVPLYVLLIHLRLNNSYLGLILVHVTFTLPLTSWVLQDFYRSIPIDLEQAGYVDGASLLKVLWHIVLPLSVPGLLAAGAYAFILSWNEFLFAFLLISVQENFTAPVGIHAYFTARGASDDVWSQLMAASVMVSLPSVALFAFFQRYLVAGFLRGAVKG